MAMGREFSIERRILLIGIGFLLAVGSLLFLVVQFYAHHAADEAFDRVLSAAALSIADTVEIEDGAVSVDIPHSAFAILGSSRLNRVFYRIVAPDGSLVTGSPTLGLEVEPASDPRPRFSDSAFRGAPIRIATVARYHADTDTGGAGWVDIIVAETREARDALASQLTINATFPALAVGLLACLMLWLSVRFAFRPLRVIEANLTSRAPSNLEAMDPAVPQEVKALVVSLNAFMARLSTTLAGLQRVTADASHQLRTPLTALRALAEIAIEEASDGADRRRLQRIHANAVNASVLANQLLSDATTLHRLETQQREALDLRQVIHDALRRLRAEGSHGAAFEMLNVVLPEHPCWVHAEPISLREMIRNLVENAYVHAPGPVEVSVRGNAEHWVLTVADRGPGISSDLGDSVFDRFVRGQNEQPGSGLGLAIARDVAIASGGTIALVEREGGGLTVAVTLPEYHPAPLRIMQSLGLPLALVVAVLFSGFAPETAMAGDSLRIAGDASIQRMQPVIAALERFAPGLSVTYTQERTIQLTAAASAGARDGTAPDLILSPSADLAIQLANEGHVIQIDIPAEATGLWRQEVFAIAHDPAVMVARAGVFAEAELPHSRAALVRLLEREPDRLFRRVGVVNIGIDHVSYLLSAQDAVRSPLFWRLVGAVGASQARIYDTVDELLAALHAGKIDLAYNVPLSAVNQTGESAELMVLAAQDYTISLPWVALIPSNAKDVAGARRAVEFLLGAEGQASIALAGLLPTVSPAESGIQRVDLGPELLVYLDQLKRSRHLDTWFQLVTE